MNISAGKMLCKPFLFFLQFRLICPISDESDDDPFDLLKEGQENVCIIFFIVIKNHKILICIIITLWVEEFILGFIMW